MERRFLFIFLILSIVTIGCNVEEYPNADEGRIGSKENNNQQANQEFKLIMPVKSSDVSFDFMGIWPFGVQGGDHPNGHPGIDFEALEDTPIMAVADGIVGNTGDSGHYNFKTISIFHENNFDTYYTGPMKEILVKEGDRVKQGQVVAYYDVMENEDFGSLHLGLQQKIPDEAICPVDYFSEEAKKEIEELFDNAKYNEKEEFPFLCNPCPNGGCY